VERTLRFLACQYFIAKLEETAAGLIKYFARLPHHSPAFSPEKPGTVVHFYNFMIFLDLPRRGL
jgi:hypothetical protein